MAIPVFHRRTRILLSWPCSRSIHHRHLLEVFGDSRSEGVQSSGFPSPLDMPRFSILASNPLHRSAECVNMYSAFNFIPSPVYIHHLDNVSQDRSNRADF